MPNRAPLIAALAGFLLGTPVLAAQQSAVRHDDRSSRADDSTAANLGVGRCFGISFGRDCTIMLQYEAGYRLRAFGGSPVVRSPYPRPQSWRNQWYRSGGLMVSTGSGSAVGLLYESGSDGDLATHALGARWARQLREDVRVDVTAGALWKPIPWYNPAVPRGETATSNGAFAEVTFHPTNLFSLSVRDEYHPSSTHASSGQAIYVGARAEAVPGLVVTAIALLFVEALKGLFPST